MIMTESVETRQVETSHSTELHHGRLDGQSSCSFDYRQISPTGTRNEGPYSGG